MLKHPRVLLFALVAAIAALTVSSAASTAVGPDSSALRAAVTTAGIMEHENEFQAIATANAVNGVPTRAVATPGYEASVDYVAGLLGDAGYEVTIQDFTYEAFIDVTPPEFDRVSPDPVIYVNGFEDFLTMTWSGTGDVTAELRRSRRDRDPGLPGGSTSGMRQQAGLRRLSDGCDRVDPARHVPVPAEGHERRGRRSGGAL